MELFDLAAADPAVRFSPYCWRIKMALAHKGLCADTIAWRFVEKDRIAFADTTKVPVLRDGDAVVADSWAILQYLDDRYPASPVFDGGRAQALLCKHLVERAVHPQMLRCVVLDIHDGLDAGDQAYFRQTREAMLKDTLESVQGGRAGHRKALWAALEPARATLGDQPFLHGDAPAVQDYLLFGAFQWCRCVSAFPLLPTDNALFDWRERMLDRFDGLARRAPGFEVGAA